ncbi:dTDP-4-dehydrorhamnose 3,5-epimerase [Prolixibacteraceae bacterium Z1-6]|uniref:dTDP-4-dehydrorhamnose 3,5-epimerase n=1 Tax=Draconibacterium aestuarii TaxID=2998507 RepID=A0A9X3J492_9BACT|nr:dTDP-4-dehydrorhamnose 3,5-epimerase [Prolixibacteraceae bacterium Z1-6]
MKVIKTTIPEVLIFEPTIHGDARGYFFEHFRQDIIEKHLPAGTAFVQGNESMSSYGVLRGLHFQRPPHAQGKLVRVVQGEVVDVAVDIRIGSPTYGQHVAVKLSGENKRQLWIPRGFAHGFAVLSETAVFSYKCDNYYNPQADGGVRYNDPAININWMLPENDIQLSDKDKNLPSLGEINCFRYTLSPAFEHNGNEQ